MNALTITQQTMTSREIAELTGKQHAHVCRDIRSMLIGIHGADRLNEIIPEQYRNRHSEYIREHSQEIVNVLFGDDPKRDHVDSRGFSWVRDTRGYVAEYRLDKDHTITLLTGYDAAARMRVIKRWQDLEAKALQPALPDFTNPAAAARAWASEYEQKQIALVQLEAAQPAIEFHERVGDADSLHSIDETAKVLRAPPMKFRRYLKDTLQLFRIDGLPKQPFLNSGYVRTVETILPHTGKPYPQTFFTGKGLQWIQRKLDHSLLGQDI